MRIAILAPITIKAFAPYINHAEDLPEGLPTPLISNLVLGLLKSNNEIIVCTLSKGIDKPKVFRGKKITLFVGRFGEYAKVRAFTKFTNEIKQMTNFLKSIPECDVYGAHWSYEYSQAALNVSPKKTVVTMHDWPEAIYNLQHDYYRKKRMQMSFEVCENAENFTCPSKYIYDLFKRKYDNKNMIIIPNFIDDLIINNKDKHKRNSNFKIIAVNNAFDKRKNTKVTLEAYKIIKNKLNSVELNMYGNCYEKGGVAEKWAVDNDYSESVNFKGKIKFDELIKVYKDADLIIHPALEESFGCIYIEAMAAKTPVIAAKNSGGAPWILDEGKYGALVNGTNPKEIADKAISILTNQEIWDNYVDEAFKNVCSKFTSKQVVEEYLKEYMRVAKC